MADSEAGTWMEMMNGFGDLKRARQTEIEFYS